MGWKPLRFGLLAIGILLAKHGPATAQQFLKEAPGKAYTLPMPRAQATSTPEEDRSPAGVRVIDLPTVLRLAGVYNPEINLARERVLEAVAVRQLAAAQLLPDINFGADINHHQGPLQQATGKILDVNRDSVSVGLGTAVVGAGTVNVPGIFWNANVSDVYFNILVTRQKVRQRDFESEAVRNEVLLRVAAAYLELLRAYGHRAIAVQIQTDSAEVARVTANWAKLGQGLQADAERAATANDQRLSDIVQADNDIQLASARLCELLSLDPSERLQPQESQVVPNPLVPELISLPELIVIALTRRPELHARQAAIRAAFLELQHAKVLPFSPQLALGYSAGGFGGGSNLVDPRFGNFNDREDVDAVLYWSLKNLGVGNVALIRQAQSQFRQSRLKELIVLDRVRSEVATASAQIRARLAQIEIQEKAIRSSQNAFKEDMLRTKNKQGLPIEVLDSLRLTQRSRYAYLDAIIDYDRAHFALYVALGQPPAPVLARPVPANAATAPDK